MEVLVSHLQHVVLNGPDDHQDEEAAQGELGDGPLSVPDNLLRSAKGTTDNYRLISRLYKTHFSKLP